MDRADHAPEVVEGNGGDGLIPLSSPKPKSEPPEVYAGPSPSGYQSPPAYAGAEEKIPNNGVAHHATRESARRKRKVWYVVGAVLLALAAGLGAGLGVGLSQNRNSDSQKSDPVSGDGQGLASISSTPTQTSLQSSSTTATSTAPVVSSGTTGVAAFTCRNDKPRKSNQGIEYIQECNTQYSEGHASVHSVDGNVTIANLGGTRIVYSFKECLNACDKYNDSGEQPPCRAVTYYANMTVPIARWGGNCFLKNDQGTNRNGDNFVDWGHTASAYQSCLNVSCWPENR